MLEVATVSELKATATNEAGIGLVVVGVGVLVYVGVTVFVGV